MPAPISLSKTALLMRNGNPEAFEAFCRGLDYYKGELVDQLTKADSATVLQAQGRVQTVDVLLRLLKECHIEKPKPTPPIGGNPAL